MRFKNLKQFYEYICELDGLKKIAKFSENMIIIPFHNNFKVKIKEKHYFDVYVNEYFYYEIESEEIIDFLLEIINKQVAFIEDERKSKIIQIPYKNINHYLNKDYEKIICILD